MSKKSIIFAPEFETMLGAILGDTVGSVHEFNNTKTTDFPLFRADSIYTDDSVMTMAVAEWLLADKEHTHSALVETIDRYAKQYPCPMGGYGGMFRKWLAMPNEQKLPYNSFGNGSAMRVAACGWMAHSRQEALMLAKISAEVTHNHPEGIKGAQAVAASIYMLRHGALKCDVREYVEAEFGYNLSRSCDDIRPGYQFDETCQATILEAAALPNVYLPQSFVDVLKN